MSEILPVITLYQPWATWIMWGWKTIETRTHNRFASLEGKTILIHAGKAYDKHALPNDYLDVDQYTVAKRFEDTKWYPQGRILGSVFVSNFRQLDGEDSLPSRIDCEPPHLRWGLILIDVKELPTYIPVDGERGIWYFDLVTEQKVKKPK